MRVKGQAGLTCGQDDPPLLVDSNSRLYGRGKADGENGISERQALVKSCSHYRVGRSESQHIGQDDPLSSYTPTPDFVDRGILTGKMTFWRDKCLAKVVPTMLIHVGGKPFH